jgi:hypothetical protein
MIVVLILVVLGRGFYPEVTKQLNFRLYANHLRGSVA